MKLKPYRVLYLKGSKQLARIIWATSAQEARLQAESTKGVTHVESVTVADER